MAALAETCSNNALERRKKALAIVQAASDRYHGSVGPRGAAVPTGCVDSALPRGGLERGAVHEWIGVDEPEGESQLGRGHTGRTARWAPPLTLLVQIARQSLAGNESDAAHVVWIGQRIWPYAPVLDQRSGAWASGPCDLLAASLFVQAQTVRERVWAADLALRSRGVASVVVDGSGFDLPATRRLQLAAEAGGSLCLLARPPWEQSVLSAANTRWVVRCCPTFTTSRRWTVELLRCKGVQPAGQAASSRLWILERDHATRHVAVVSDILGRPGQAEAQQALARRTG